MRPGCRAHAGKFAAFSHGSVTKGRTRALPLCFHDRVSPTPGGVTMGRHLISAGIGVVALAIIELGMAGAGVVSAAPMPAADDWTPRPVPGFNADQPKLDSSDAGAVTAAWFGDLPEEFLGLRGNALVASYDGTSWSCPIQLPSTAPAIDSVPPAFDVGADGTVAVAANNWMRDPVSTRPADDVWISVRPAGSTEFVGVGTGQGYPVQDDPVVATSAARTVAVWISRGTTLVGAELLPGSREASPVVLARGEDLAFAKLRMDARGNAVIVYRSSPGDIEIQQNWLTWPAEGAPSASVKFSLDAPDDFVETPGLSVSSGGRMIIAMYDGATESTTNEIRAYVGTTTSGFTSTSTIVSGDPLPATDAVTSIDDQGHATVGFRMDGIGSTQATAYLYAVDPLTGAPLTNASFDEPGETGIDLFRMIQDGATAYLAWTDSNLQALGGGVVSFDGRVIRRELATSQSDWLGVVAGPSGPVAYWPRQPGPRLWRGPLTTTLPHKPLNAKPTITSLGVRRSGAVKVVGKITPAAAARACAGSAVAIWMANRDPYNPLTEANLVTVAADGSFTLSLARSGMKGCVKAKVTAFLQTPDSTKPASTSRQVACRR